MSLESRSCKRIMRGHVYSQTLHPPASWSKSSRMTNKHLTIPPLGDILAQMLTFAIDDNQNRSSEAKVKEQLELRQRNILWMDQSLAAAIYEVFDQMGVSDIERVCVKHNSFGCDSGNALALFLPTMFVLQVCSQTVLFKVCLVSGGCHTLTVVTSGARSIRYIWPTE